MSQAEQQLDVVILAAGKGTRLKSDTSKVLHPLFGKPLLGHVLGQLRGLPVHHVAVVVGHQREAVEQFVAKQPTQSFALTTVHQSPQRGTGHAVQCVKAAGAIQSRHVLVLSGDVPLIQPETLQQLWQQHTQSGTVVTVLGARLDNPTGYGRLLQNDAGQLIAIVEEKDASEAQRQVNLVNSGIYLLDWSVVAGLLDQLDANNAQGELYLTDVVGLAVQGEHVVSVSELTDATHMQGVNGRADLAQCHDTLQAITIERLQAAGVTIIDPASTWIGPDVVIGPDSVVYPGCYLSGTITMGSHCEIGPHTQVWGEVTTGDRVTINQSVIRDSVIANDVSIGPFAHLRNGANIGSNVRLGNFVEVKNSTLGERTNAAHLSYLGDAVIGSDVNMGAGSITANYDPVRDEKHQTVIESGVKVGCNSVLVAPVTVGENACVAAGSVITKDVDALALAITRPRQSAIAGWVSKVKQAVSAE